MSEEKKLILHTIIMNKKDIAFPGAIVEKEFLNKDDYLTFSNYKKGDTFAILFQEEKNGLDPRGLIASFIELSKKTDAKKSKQIYTIVFKVKSFYDAEELGLVVFDKEKGGIFNKLYEQSQINELAEKYNSIDSFAFGTAGHRDELVAFENIETDDSLNELNRYSDIFRSLSKPIENDSKTSSTFESIVFQNIPTKNEIITISWIDSLINKYSEFSVSKNYSLRLQEFIFTVISYLKDDYADKKEFIDFFGKKQIIEVVKNVSELLGLTAEINQTIQETMNKKLSTQQKEFILREKVKVLQEELTNINVPIVEDDYSRDLKDKVKNQIYPESVKKLISEENKRSSEMMPASPEASISKTFVSNLKKLPWRKVQKEFLDIKFARDVLDKYHYGLDKVKERIIEYIAVIINQKNNEKQKSKKLSLDNNHEVDLSLFKEDNDKKTEFNNVPIICLVGPPGTGKTSLSKAIAEALQRKFVKISLGGVHDESEIRGHRRTYVGAMPGKIIKSILKAEVSNPLILLDEIDKMASTNKGDPASAMLEVLDPEQNTKFQDHYLEHEYDLSKAIFIATANYYENIPHALIDRVEVIELSSYTLSEKVNIAKTHLMPKVAEQVGLNKGFFKIDDKTLEYIIKHYTSEAGVRGLKRILDKIARKITVKLLDSKKELKSFTVKIEDLEDLIGVVIFKQEQELEDEKPGTVNGLAYTSTGGSTLQIEVNIFPGKEEIKITGSLKDVMKESAQISLSYVRSNAEKFGIKDFDFDKNTIHIHVPEGAVPKDGPSAGVTFTTALISALKKVSVPSYYGMTGEITLRGKVLDIGGLKEKSFAASQKSIQKVFIPHGNVKNLKDIPDEIKRTLTYIPVKNYEEIYDVIFNNKKPIKEIKE
ncbi:peptidase [Mycoplasmopsis canis]|uniref:endopeptidase La n=1 Tax=Mycoplasmopsis canis TaxID=29555 RepID=UPI000624ABF4|nr:endopeptidase La [Mycoplasmopsis canis]AKF41056.1 peptidase [Mycoplasmopsis canis]